MHAFTVVTYRLKLHAIWSYNERRCQGAVPPPFVIGPYWVYAPWTLTLLYRLKNLVFIRLYICMIVCVHTSSTEIMEQLIEVLFTHFLSNQMKRVTCPDLHKFKWPALTARWSGVHTLLKQPDEKSHMSGFTQIQVTFSNELPLYYCQSLKCRWPLDQTISILLCIKPNYFKKQCSSSSFLLT